MVELTKHHLHLLRKRHRLPISLLRHETPPGSPLSELGVGVAESPGALTALISSSYDISGLAKRCEDQGFGKLYIQYADFISLGCVSAVKDEIEEIRRETNITVVVVNPWVPKEKTRLLHKVTGLSTSLDRVYTMVKEEGDSDVDPQQQQQSQQLKRLQEMSSEFAMDRDRAGKRTRALEREKQRSLDHLILLELRQDAPPLARAEGRWLLKRGSYNFAHVGDKLSANLLEVIRSQMEESRGDNGGVPSPTNLCKVRRHVLRAFGRYHLESKLHILLKEICVSMDQYLLQELSNGDLCEALLSRKNVLNDLMHKRSLIGCHLINLDDPLGWEYDMDTDNEDQSATIADGLDNDSESDLMSGSESDEVDGPEEFRYDQDDFQPEARNVDHDEYQEFLYDEANHGGDQAADIWQKGMVFEKGKYGRGGHVGSISQGKDRGIHTHDDPKGSVNTMEGPTEADILEESPISTSTIVSTDSENPYTEFAQLLAKHGDLNGTGIVC